MENEIGRIEEPARLLRMSAMVRALLDEARELPLDEHARERLHHIHGQAVKEIADSVAPELREELERLLPASSALPSQGEIRITHSQLVGWLDGVFQGIKAGLALQHAALRGEGPLRQGLPSAPAAGPPAGAGPYL